MRIHFTSLARPKRAAKAISSLVPGVALARAQAAVAALCGYRDWHDLEGGHAAGPARPDLAGAALRQAGADMALRLSADLGIGDGAAQHALSSSRLLTAGEWTLADNLAVRTECWRRTGALRGWEAVPFSETWGGSAYRSGRHPRYVYSYRGQPVLLGSETVPADAAPGADFVSPRLYLPYGRWTMGDGSSVLFSRDYKALWRLAGGRPERLDPQAWVDGIVAQEWFWVPDTDPFKDPDRMAGHVARLEGLGLGGLPALADRQPELMEAMRVPQPFQPGLDGIPARYKVLSWRGEDRGARHGMSPWLFTIRGGSRPWHQIGMPGDVRAHSEAAAA